MEEMFFRVFYYYEGKRKDFLLLCSRRRLYLVPTYSLVQWESQRNRSSGEEPRKVLLVDFSERYSIAFKWKYYAHMDMRSLQEWITKSGVRQYFSHYRIRVEDIRSSHVEVC